MDRHQGEDIVITSVQPREADSMVHQTNTQMQRRMSIETAPQNSHHGMHDSNKMCLPTKSAKRPGGVSEQASCIAVKGSMRWTNKHKLRRHQCIGLGGPSGQGQIYLFSIQDDAHHQQHQYDTIPTSLPRVLRTNPTPLPCVLRQYHAYNNRRTL